MTKFKINHIRIAKTVGILLLALMQIFIAQYFVLKAIMLLLLIILCGKSNNIATPVKILCAFLCISTLWGILIGCLKGTENPFQYFFLGLGWPVLSLFILLPLLKTENDFKSLFHYYFYIHSFVILYDIGFAFSTIFGFPFYNLYPEVEIGFTLYDTSSRMNFANLNVLTYTVPIYFMIYLSNYDIRINRFFQFVMVLLSLFLIIFCGRRSLMGLFIYTPIMALLFRKQLPKETSQNIVYFFTPIFAIIICALLYIFIVQTDVFWGYVDTFTKAFDSSEEPLKFRQARMLYNEFLDSPFCGQGAGKYFYDTVRHYRSSNFEIVYLLILATRGMIGFLFYILGIWGPLFVGLKIAVKKKDTIFLFMLISYSYIIMAEISNPIMNGFDLILPLLFNYAKINSLYLESIRTRKKIYNH